jgi:hypothetical protein
MSGHVRERLPQHGQQLLADRRGDRRIHRPGGAHHRREPEHGDVLLHQASHVGAQRQLVTVLQLEDRRTDVTDRHVELGDSTVDALPHFVAHRDPPGALQLQSGGEEPLDHQVVEVARDPVAV